MALNNLDRHPLAAALLGMGLQDQGMVPDNYGGFVPITNSRIDPTTGDFLPRGHEDPLSGFRSSSSIEPHPNIGSGQNTLVAALQGQRPPQAQLAQNISPGIPTPVPRPSPDLPQAKEPTPDLTPHGVPMTPYQQALKQGYDTAHSAWEDADRRVRAAAGGDPRVMAIYQDGATHARERADYFVSHYITSLKEAGAGGKDWHPAKVSPGDHVYNPDTGRYEVPVPAEPASPKRELKEVGVDPYTGERKYRWFTEGSEGEERPQEGPRGLLAKGVTSIDDSLSGDAYLQQFSPTAKQEIQGYLDGTTMPTGNPRSGHVQTIKAAAAKFGGDTGQQVDDTTFFARKQMRTQLSSAQPNSLGGQINTGNTALDHLADVAAAASVLGNSGGWGFAPLAHAINAARGLGTDQAARMAALKDAAHHYGQEITKFYAGSPGGEQERLSFEKSIDATKSPQELAAVIAQEMTLMRGRLAAVGSQIQGTLGDRGTAQYPVIQPGGQSGIARLNKILPGLARGEAATVGGAQEPARVQTPSIGTVKGGYKFLGGDPAARNSWEKVP